MNVTLCEMRLSVCSLMKSLKWKLKFCVLCSQIWPEARWRSSRRNSVSSTRSRCTASWRRCSTRPTRPRRRWEVITSRFTPEAPAVNPSRDVRWTRWVYSLHVCVADLFTVFTPNIVWTCSSSSVWCSVKTSRPASSSLSLQRSFNLLIFRIIKTLSSLTDKEER